MLVTNEKLEAYDNEQTPDDEERKTSNGATDEELTSLTWLHDKNLLKGLYSFERSFTYSWFYKSIIIID